MYGEDTRPEMFRRFAQRFQTLLLVPGVGAQGGTVQDVAKHGMSDTCGLLVNSSGHFVRRWDRGVARGNGTRRRDAALVAQIRAPWKKRLLWAARRFHAGFCKTQGRECPCPKARCRFDQ